MVPPTVAIVEQASADICVLTSGSDSLDGLAFHIAMLGFDVTVLDPPELIERMKALAARLAQAGQAPGAAIKVGAAGNRVDCRADISPARHEECDEPGSAESSMCRYCSGTQALREPRTSPTDRGSVIH